MTLRLLQKYWSILLFVGSALAGMWAFPTRPEMNAKFEGTKALSEQHERLHQRVLEQIDKRLESIERRLK